MMDIGVRDGEQPRCKRKKDALLDGCDILDTSVDAVLSFVSFSLPVRSQFIFFFFLNGSAAFRFLSRLLPSFSPFLLPKVFLCFHKCLYALLGYHIFGTYATTRIGHRSRDMI